MHPTDEVLNAYADGTLDASERTGVDAHLAACAACRDLVEDLRAIASLASTLEPRQPSPRVWNRIERAIQLEHQTTTPAEAGHDVRSIHVRSISARWMYTLAAAAVVVIATAVGLQYRSGTRALAPAAAPTTASAAPEAGNIAGTAQSGNAVSGNTDALETEMRQAAQHYEKAIKGLEQIARDDQGALDSRTAATLQKNLAVIDQAIGESRAAVRSEPASEPAQQSLIENFKSKLALLEDTVALINEMRKGNEAGTARIVSGLKTKGD